MDIDKFSKGDTRAAEAGKIRRSGKYYLDVVIFQVEDELFKVPKDPFIQQSAVFKDMFSMPQATSGSTEIIEGKDDDKPIVLAGVQKAAFILLLDILLPLMWESSDTNAKYSRGEPIQLPQAATKYNLAQWFLIYELSTMWFMENVKARAISMINALMDKEQDPMQKLRYGRRYNRDDWLMAAYKCFSNDRRQKVDTLSEDEINEIGVPISFEILKHMIARLGPLEERAHIRKEQVAVQEAYRRGEGFPRDP